MFFMRDRRKEGVMLNEIIGIIGFILLLLGAGGMDSESLLALALMTLLGIALLSLVAKDLELSE